MNDGLFEMRMKSKEGIGRVFYCTLVNKRIVCTFIKKTKSTPSKDLKIAISRMNEVKANVDT